MSRLRRFFALFLVSVIAVVGFSFSIRQAVPAFGFDYEWEEDKPDGDLDDISTGDDQMRDDKKAIRERMAIDHYWLSVENGESELGYHKTLHLVDQLTESEDTDTLFNLGGDLYWHDTSDNQIKLTYNGRLNSAKFGNLSNIPADAGLIPPANGAAPPGAMLMWLTDTAPTGWLLCYGQAVSRETYATLFAVIGTTFGTGDGSTTFNLPDLRGRIPLGQDDMGGSSANRVTDSDADTIGGADGVESVTLTAAQSGLPAHTHTVGKVNNNDGGSGGIQQAAAANTTTQNTGSVSAADASEAHTNMPPFLTVNYIIKY